MERWCLVILAILFLTVGYKAHATAPSCAAILSGLTEDKWSHVPALRSAENAILIDYQTQHSVPANGLTGIQGPSSYQVHAKPVWVNFRNPNLRSADRVHVMVINYSQSFYRGEKMALNSENYEFDLQFAEDGRFTGAIPTKENGILIAYQKNDGYAVSREEVRQEIVVWVNGNIVKDPISGNNFGLRMDVNEQKRNFESKVQTQEQRQQYAANSERSRSVVEQFFSNYGLIGNWPNFQNAQMKLLTTNVTTIFSDHRGEKAYSGPSGYFSSLGDWSQVFSTLSELEVAERKKEGKDADPFRVEIVQVDGDKVVARLHGTLKLQTPIDGLKELRDEQHSWTETFRLDPQGHIHWLKVEMNIKASPSLASEVAPNVLKRQTQYLRRSSGGYDIVLITREELKHLSPGTIVESLQGEKLVVGKDEIDDETRSGFVAFGLRIEPSDAIRIKAEQQKAMAAQKYDVPIKIPSRFFQDQIYPGMSQADFERDFPKGSLIIVEMGNVSIHGILKNHFLHDGALSIVSESDPNKEYIISFDSGETWLNQNSPARPGAGALKINSLVIQKILRR